MKITFVGPLVSTFVKNDATILRQEHEVDAIDSNIGRGKMAVFRLAKLHLSAMYSLLTRDALFCWFADYYSLIPSLFARLLGKKVFVIVGGFEIMYIPELGIGARTRPLRWFAVKNTIRVASHIFPVSNDTLNEIDLAVPNHAPCTVIYSAVDTKRYYFDPRPRKRVALTVSQADSIPEYIRKGIDMFIKVAKELPDVDFRVVGLSGHVEEKAKQDAQGIPNVTIRTGRKPLDPEEFWEASVYCQLSMSETFGLSVAESMSCGCIPVISQDKAMMEVIGEFGYVVDRTDTKAIVTAIKSALEAPDSYRQAVSVAGSKFDTARRSKMLLALVKSVGGGHGKQSSHANT